MRKDELSQITELSRGKLRYRKKTKEKEEEEKLIAGEICEIESIRGFNLAILMSNLWYLVDPVGLDAACPTG